MNLFFANGITEARKYGTSETSTWERSLIAPNKALTALIASLIDIPSYPLKGFSTAIIDVAELSPYRAACSIASGMINGLRSLYQVALIVSTMVVGVFIPRIMYAALPDVKTAPKIPVENSTIAMPEPEKSPNKLETPQPGTQEAADLKKELDALKISKTKTEANLNSRIQNVEAELKTARTAAQEATELKKEIEALKSNSDKTEAELRSKIAKAEIDFKSKIENLQSELDISKKDAKRAISLQEELDKAKNDKEKTEINFNSKMTNLQSQLKESYSEIQKLKTPLNSPHKQ